MMCSFIYIWRTLLLCYTLRTQQATLAAAPLYATQQRVNVIDFSVPFMSSYTTILLRRSYSNTDNGELPSPPHNIRSVGDLLRQTDIRYGTMNKGVLVRAFRRTNVARYRLLWRRMLSFEPSALTRSNEEGIERLRRRGGARYAFLLPHAIGEYVSYRRPCDLETIGRFLMHRGGYVLGIAKNSTLRRPLNAALRMLADSGYLDGLYRKWWFGRNECAGATAAQLAAQAAMDSTRSGGIRNRELHGAAGAEGAAGASTNGGRSDLSLRWTLSTLPLVGQLFAVAGPRHRL